MAGLDMGYGAISDRYRKRIAGNSRTKLTKAERIALTGHFVNKLQKCKAEGLCKSLCEMELGFLEDGYPTASIANKYLPQWRKAIQDAIDNGVLTNEIDGENIGAIALKYLKFPDSVHYEIKARTDTSNKKKMRKLTPIRVNRVIEKAKDLLNGEGPQEWAAGLLTLTGRRFSEMCAKGSFQLTEHPYALAFKGQLKKRKGSGEAEQTFMIPTLIEAKDVLSVIERFRSHQRIKELSGLQPEQINSRFNTSVRHHIKRVFEDTGIIPKLEGEKSVSAHNLRGVYARIASYFFCPEMQEEKVFLEEILGHVIGEDAREKSPGSKATQHYLHYCITNSQGKRIGALGIMLDKVGELPKTVKPIKSKAVVSRRKRNKTASLAAESMGRLKAIAIQKLNLPANTTNSQTADAVAAFMEDDKTQGVLSSVESVSTMFIRLYDDIQRLQAENQRLRDELSQSAQPIESPTIPTPAPTIKAKTVELTPTPEQKTTTPKGVSDVPEKPVQRITDEGRALALINMAIDSIMAWNDTPKRSYEAKWYVSGPAIKQLLRGNGLSAAQARVKKALDSRADEIANHNASHDMGVRHNTKHKSAIAADVQFDRG